MKARAFWPGALLVALGVWVYWPALYGGWIWDDYMYVPENPALRSLAGLRSLWFAPPGVNYFPVTFTVQWIQWHLWGNATFGYHLTNLALHLANCFLVGGLVRRLSNRTAGWTAALLFAVHPLAVESVAWICEIKNVLSLTLLLGAILFYLRFDEIEVERDLRARWAQPRAGAELGLCPARPEVALHLDQSARCYAFSLGLFVLAMLSKSTVIMFPAVMLLYVWWKRGRVRRSDLLALLPFTLAALSLGLVTIWFEHHRTMAVVGVTPESLPVRIAVAGLGLAFYLFKSVIPIGLMPNYPRWSMSPLSPLQFLPWAGLIALTGWFWVKRATWGRTLLLAWGWFVLNLVPVLGLISMSYLRIAWVADHFAYLSLVVVVGMAGAGICGYQKEPSGEPPLPDPKRGKRSATRAIDPRGWTHNRPKMLLIGGGAAVLGLAALSRSDARIYRSEEAFWNYAAEQNPSSWNAQNNLGLVFAKNGQVAQALARYETTLRLKPDDATTLSNLANLLSNEPGRQADAIAAYERALRLSPDLAGVHHNFAGLLARLPGRQAEAIAEYERALRLNPDFAEAHKNLADLLGSMPGRQAEALVQYEQALRVKADFAEAQNNWGLLLARDPARRGEALEHFESAVRLDPGLAEAQENLADWLAGQPGRQAEAIAHYESALRLNPGYAEAHNNLAGVLLSQPGRQPEAVSHYEAALRAKPDFAEAHQNLADVLAGQPGHEREAIAHYENAVRLQPDFAKAHNHLGLFLSLQPGRQADALVELERAVRLQPDSFFYHFCLGRELAKSPSRRREAASQLAAALQLNPAFEPAHQALESLK